MLSNSILVVSAENASGNNLVIRDKLNEILELVPCAPKLHKLGTLTRGMQYDDLEEGEHPGVTRFLQHFRSSFSDRVRTQGPSISYEDARVKVQASNAEFDRGIRERRILIIKGMRV